MTAYAYGPTVSIERNVFRGEPGSTTYRAVGGSRRGVVLLDNTFDQVILP